MAKFDDIFSSFFIKDYKSNIDLNLKKIKINDNLIKNEFKYNVILFVRKCLKYSAIFSQIEGRPLPITCGIRDAFEELFI